MHRCEVAAPFRTAPPSPQSPAARGRSRRRLDVLFVQPAGSPGPCHSDQALRSTETLLLSSSAHVNRRDARLIVGSTSSTPVRWWAKRTSTTMNCMNSATQIPRWTLSVQSASVDLNRDRNGRHCWTREAVSKNQRRLSGCRLTLSWRLVPPPRYLLLIQAIAESSLRQSSHNALRLFERINFKAFGGEDAF